MRVRIELIAYSRVRKKYAIKNAGDDCGDLAINKNTVIRECEKKRKSRRGEKLGRYEAGWAELG